MAAAAPWLREPTTPPPRRRLPPRLPASLRACARLLSNRARRFWDCCGDEGAAAPGCCSGWHITYDDDLNAANGWRE